MHEVNRLFSYVLSNKSENDIAKSFGVHTNTVNRWKEIGIPKNYRGDLLRLIGKSDDDIGKEREKDQFYTKPCVARHCYKIFGQQVKQLGISTGKYFFIEPAAGCGYFYSLLPKNRRIGIDVKPSIKDIEGNRLITSDYLKWTPPEKCKYIVIGNPPFGLRGHLALQFINHSYLFADIVAFILPPLFNSDGKGVPAKRVEGYKLAYTENLPDDSFMYPNGRDVNVSCIFQIWTKINLNKIKTKKRKTCKQYIRVYSLSDGGTPASTRNKNMLYNCDVYIPSTCFTGMCIYNSFESLPHRRGYGVKILKNKKEIKNIFRKCDLKKIAFKSTNGALNLRTSLIEGIVTQGGFYDC